MAASAPVYGKVRDSRTIMLTPDEVFLSLPHWNFKRSNFGAGEIWYITYQGKGVLVTLGDYENYVTFPYGISEPYDAAKQGKQNAGDQFAANSMIPQGAVATAVGAESDTSYKKKNIRVVVNESQVEYRMAQAIDEFIVRKISENSIEWLNIKDVGSIKAKPKSPEMILENYTFTVRKVNMKGEEVPPYFGVKVNPTGTNYLIYTGVDPETGTKRLHTRGTDQDVKNGSYGRIAVKIQGLYYVGKKWGLSLVADSIDVFQSVVSTDCGFADSDDIVIVDRPQGLHIGCIPDSELNPSDVDPEHHNGFVLGSGGHMGDYPGTDGFGAYPSSASMMSGTKRKIGDVSGTEENEAKRTRY